MKNGMRKNHVSSEYVPSISDKVIKLGSENDPLPLNGIYIYISSLFVTSFIASTVVPMRTDIPDARVSARKRN